MVPTQAPTHQPIVPPTMAPTKDSSVRPDILSTRHGREVTVLGHAAAAAPVGTTQKGSVAIMSPVMAYARARDPPQAHR